MRVVRYVTYWYHSFRLKHQTGMSRNCGQGIMVKNGYFLAILKLRRDGAAEIAHNLECHAESDPL
jgi:hypothetical protein